MKKLLLFLAVISVTTMLTAQSPFKPVPKSLFSSTKDLTVKPSQWLFRISAGISATQWTIEDKKIVQSTFAKFGIGGSYAHFIEQEGQPYNDVSVNGFVFFPTDGSKLTIAATISALKYINIGLCYDFGLKHPGLLTGLSYTF